MPGPRWSRGERLAFALATLAYLLVALVLLRNVLPEPTNLLPYNSGITPAQRQMGHFDQSMVISTITRNANVLLTEPWNLLGDGQCYPFSQSFTLGEHMFGEGFQMAIPWLLTGDPILSYNLLMVLTLWLPGITMYLLAHHFTRHAGASFMAGLFFLLSPLRIIDGGHPYLHAEFWLPLILLYLHKLFTEDRRWLHAAAIGLFLSLEALETIYVLIASALVAAVYGLHLVVHFRDRLTRMIGPLVAAVLVAVGVAWMVLEPYLHTRETWNVLQGRTSLLLPLNAYGPGSPYFPGVLTIVMIAIGLLDRARRRREALGDDPRLAILASGLVLLWASVVSIPVPGTDWAIPGLFMLLRGIVPGLDAVRGLFAITVGLWVPMAFLAGYGALALLEQPRRALSVTVGVLLTLALVGERLLLPVTMWNFGTPLALAAWEARPAEDDIDLIRSASHGPTLDLPMPKPAHSFARLGLSRHLLLQSWSPRPSSSCYNSFDTPLAAQISQLSDALPTIGAAEALAAVGFGTLLIHKDSLLPMHAMQWNTRFDNEPRAREVMQAVAESSGLRAFRLTPQSVVHQDITKLSGGGLGAPVKLEAPADDATALVIPFVFSNPGPDTFRHPHPLVPRDALLRWHTDGLPVGSPEEVRVMWPIALGAGGLLRTDAISRAAPEPGTYSVTLSSADHPNHPLASRAVTVPTTSGPREGPP